jgi:hypothetical protein
MPGARRANALRPRLLISRTEQTADLLAAAGDHERAEERRHAARNDREAADQGECEAAADDP